MENSENAGRLMLYQQPSADCPRLRAVCPVWEVGANIYTFMRFSGRGGRLEKCWSPHARATALSRLSAVAGGLPRMGGQDKETSIHSTCRLSLTACDLPHLPSGHGSRKQTYILTMYAQPGGRSASVGWQFKNAPSQVADRPPGRSAVAHRSPHFSAKNFVQAGI